MKKVKGFTLIELLIVVAIIAILAAIAVPNFLEAQVRSKVSRAQSDMRSLSLAVEAYSVDASQYVASATPILPMQSPNSNLRGTGKAKLRCTFRLNSTGELMQTLTSPVSFITSYPPDPFADSRGAVFGYANALENGWIMWSYGPDGDESSQGDLDPASTSASANNKLNGASLWRANSVYNPGMSNPTSWLLVCGATYDPTNGSTSSGDVWRVKQ